MSLKIPIRFPLESCCWKNVLWVNFHSLSRAVFCMNQLPGENVVCLFCTRRLRQHLHIKLTRRRERKLLTWEERGRDEEKTVLISQTRQCYSKTKNKPQSPTYLSPRSVPPLPPPKKRQKNPLKYLYRFPVCCVTYSSKNADISLPEIRSLKVWD